MIDIANHARQKDKTDPKVGGHPAACSSAMHILGALHLHVKGPFDHLAIKPHASPMDHSYNYLLKNLFKHNSIERLSDTDQKTAMSGLRKFSQNGEPVFQSYHSSWDPDGLNFFPSGSVGIPPVMAAYLAHAYRFSAEHGYKVPPDAHFWSLIGDSEFREGSLYEAMPDAAEREIGNLTWIVDYNRQSLDGHRITNRHIMDGTDDIRIQRTSVANGWEVIQVRHGKKRQAAFKKPDGELFKQVLENQFDDYEFQSLLGAKDDKKVREAFVAKDKKLQKFIDALKPGEAYELLFDLGGHDIAEVIAALVKSKQNPKKPCVVICHTVKGWGLNCLAVSGNHSTLPEKEEIEALKKALNIPSEEPFKRPDEKSEIGRFLKARGDALYEGYKKQFQIKQENENYFLNNLQKTNSLPSSLGINLKMVPIAHTQWMLGQLAAKLTRIANTPLDTSKLKENQKPLNDEELRLKTASELLITLAPDVGTSTNLNPTMDGKIFAPEVVEDFEEVYKVKDTKSPDVVPGEEVSHRHLRFEIAEGNAMSCAGSYGKMRDITGIPVLPLMTVYDFFIKRALDQLFYNLYWGSSFILVGTPSGVSLSPEGAQHGWKSDIQIPNMITWEPMFALELDWIFTESMRLHLENKNQGRSGVVIRAVTRGLEQNLFLKCLKKQKRFENLSENEILEATRIDCLNGAYYLTNYQGYEGYEPGDNVVNILAMGTMGTEALKASEALLEKGIFANVIMVSSPDLLLGNLAYENDFEHLKNLGINGNLYLTTHMNGNTQPADLITVSGKRVPLVSVHDGEPGLLDNAGSIVGVKQIALSVRHHSKSGRPNEIYKYHNIDSQSVVHACGKVLSETALEQIELSQELLSITGLQQQHSASDPFNKNWQNLWPDNH
ncbi:MAG: pyruvate dehydrogenase [Oligoflexia bacterium]|nr:pyruvate dehydrogenase [Oligoflexia bacterium]